MGGEDVGLKRQRAQDRCDVSLCRGAEGTWRTSFCCPSQDKLVHLHKLSRQGAGDGSDVAKVEGVRQTMRGKSALRRVDTFGVDRENGWKISAGWMRGVDRAGDLHEFEGMEGVDVGGGEHALVAVAAEAVKDIGGGHWRHRTRERNIEVETKGRRRWAPGPSLVSERSWIA